MTAIILNNRRQIAFVRSLLSGQAAILQKNGLYKINDKTRCASLCHSEVKTLVSNGVLSEHYDEVRANRLTKNWLKRSMAEQNERFTEQHQKIKINVEGKKLNLNESALLRLSVGQKGKAPYLQAHHVEAGRRFTRLYERAYIRSSVTMAYGEMGGAGSKKSANVKKDISDMAIDARKEIDRLISRLPSDCSSIIIDICGLEKGLQLIESERGWPRRSAKLVLRIGLEQLANIYGLSSMATGLKK